MFAEDYAEQVRRDNFKEPKYILKTFYEGDYNNNIEDDDVSQVNSFCDTFNKQYFFSGKLEFLCQYLDKDDISDKLSSLIPSEYLTIYKRLGTKICKANKYEQYPLLQKLEILDKQDEVKQQIQALFNVGDTVLCSQVKNKIKQVYSRLNLKAKPTSTEIHKYFQVDELRIGKNRNRYYKIVGIL